MSQSQQILGLKKLRKNSIDDEPKYKCENCQCKRYSPCKCIKRTKEEPNVQSIIK